MADNPDDLCYLERLDNDSILNCLEKRYTTDQIYTYIGDVLVVLNPCKTLRIYDEKRHVQYFRLECKSQQPPHIFWTADLAYRSVTDSHVSRCIIVSGISGAGKTESTKHILKHVLTLGDSQKCTPQIMSKLEKIDPFLEIFGNAKTSLNDNSSRFGKLTILQYDSGNLVGAKIQHFTLEKSRVIRQKNGKNFHIFYAMLAGLPQQQLQEYGLTCHNGLFRILTDISQEDAIHTCSANPAYKKKYEQILDHFKALGFEHEDVDDIFKIIAAILLLTNIEFTEDEFGRPVIEEDIEAEYLHPVCDLLGIHDSEILIQGLLFNEISRVDDRIPKTMQGAEEGRDALAKYLYSRVFDGIVKHINETLSHRDRHISGVSEGRIGILDISGFENLQGSQDEYEASGQRSCRNSYEQLFINITNEKLHQFFLKHVFMHEKEEYERDGIIFEDIKYTNNADVLDLLVSGSPNKSIVSLMEDCNQHPGSTDESFVLELFKHFDQLKPKKQNPNPLTFEVNHFAGKVVYSSNDFLAKNTDTLSASLRNCIVDSENPFLKRLTRCNSLSTKAMEKFSKGRSSENNLQGCVSRDYMKSQLNLSKTLETMKPLFVRCIKPNTSLKACTFDRNYVRQQLQSSGVLEVAEVRSEGHSVRITRHEFIQRFTELIGHKNPMTDEEKITCIVQQVELQPSDFRLGNKKVFMKEKPFDQLNKKLKDTRQEKRRREEEEMTRRLKMKEMEFERIKHVVETQITKRNETARTPYTAEYDGSITVVPSSVTRGHGTLKSSPHTSQRSNIETDEEDDEEEEEEEEIPVKHEEDKKAYDMFKGRPQLQTTTNFIDTLEKIFLRVSRVLMYIILFCMVLLSGVFVKIWILSLVSKLVQKSSKDNEANADRLMVCLIVPWGITFLLSLIKVLFGKTKSMQWKYLVPIVLIDASQAMGVMLMLFMVLPKVDVFRGAVMMMCVGSTPALFVFFKTVRKVRFNSIRFLKIIVSLLSLGFQVGCCFALCIENNGHTTNFPIWALVLSCFLISLGWWDNFAHGQINICKLCSLDSIDFDRIKSVLKQSRRKSNVCRMFVKILVTVLFIQFYVKSDNYNQVGDPYFLHRSSVYQGLSNVEYTNTSFNSTLNTVSKTNTSKPLKEVALQLKNETFITCQINLQINVSNKESRILCSLDANTVYVCTNTNETYKDCMALIYVPNNDNKKPKFGDDVFGSVYRFYLHNDVVFHVIVFTLICTYAATLACKLKMQVLAFSLPIVLVPPLTLVVVYINCENIILMEIFIPNGMMCPKFDMSDLKYTVAIAALLWLSSIAITWYIWIPRNERMAKIESMFVEPLKESVFLDINLLFRRSHDKTDTTEYRSGSSEQNPENDNYVNNVRQTVPRTITDSAKVENNPDHKISKNNQRLFICATLWREERREVLQLLQSLFRLDKHCLASKCAEEKFDTHNPDKFQPEIHIMFDDAFTKHNTYNEFVEQLIELVGIAAKSVVGEIKWQGIPYKCIHPYGERLVWKLPGKTKLIVHLKDKSKIRNRKRWSQIMYLYYLLGFMFTDDMNESVFLTKPKLSKKKKSDGLTETTFEETNQEKIFHTKRSPLERLPTDKRAEITNTFILTLDGDVDFQPEAVLLLLDRMKKNEKVGAVCGRIHPLGSGPMVWYQKFEYAIGHWLQKATEHVLGCVLCCPGCFSLFRASALISDGVMKTYTTKPQKATEYIQYEQGEDRWLCTLLLQRGYKIDYCAGADAFTYAPESFKDFFVQRRRWAPSTMLNIMDLLSSWNMTVRVNANISRPYILYQLVMMISSLLAPATVTLMISDSYRSVLGIPTTYAYLLAIVPVVIYIIICLKCSNELQLKSGALLSAIYTIVMVVVTVGTILNLVNEELESPTVLFLMGLATIFVTAGLWHPKEIGCLFSGILYYLTVPSTFIFLTIYYLCNLNNVSWGTREGPKTGDDAPTKTGWQILSEYMKSSFCEDIITLVKGMLRKQKEPDDEESVKSLNKLNAIHTTVIDRGDSKSKKHNKKIKTKRKYIYDVSVEYENENKFWAWLIETYLEPISADVEHQNKVAAELLELRNNVVFAFFLINFMFSVALLQLQIKRDQLISFYIMGKYEPVSVAFLGVFSIILITQFICMLFHRWGTFQHLISSTELRTLCRGNKLLLNDKDFFNSAFKEMNVLMNPDYDADDDLPPDYDTDAEDRTTASTVSSRRYSNDLEKVLERNFKKQKRRYNRRIERAVQDNPVVLNKSQRTRKELYKRTIPRNYMRNDRYGNPQYHPSSWGQRFDDNA